MYRCVSFIIHLLCGALGVRPFESVDSFLFQLWGYVLLSVITLIIFLFFSESLYCWLGPPLIFLLFFSSF